MRNKFLTKILGTTLGLAMAIGVGVGVGSGVGLGPSLLLLPPPQATNAKTAKE